MKTFYLVMTLALALPVAARAEELCEVSKKFVLKTTAGKQQRVEPGTVLEIVPQAKGMVLVKLSGGIEGTMKRAALARVCPLGSPAEEEPSAAEEKEAEAAPAAAAPAPSEPPAAPPAPAPVAAPAPTPAARASVTESKSGAVVIAAADHSAAPQESVATREIRATPAETREPAGSAAQSAPSGPMLQQEMTVAYQMGAVVRGLIAAAGMGLQLGLRGEARINERLLVGLAVYATTIGPSLGTELNNGVTFRNPRYLDLWHGGIQLGYALLDWSIFELVLRTYTGAGVLGHHSMQSNDVWQGADFVWLLEPTLSLEAKLTQSMALGIAGGYHAVFGVDLPGFENFDEDDISHTNAPHFELTLDMAL